MASVAHRPNDVAATVIRDMNIDDPSLFFVVNLLVIFKEELDNFKMTECTCAIERGHRLLQAFGGILREIFPIHINIH